jgi:hypothetical protein
LFKRLALLAALVALAGCTTPADGPQTTLPSLSTTAASTSSWTLPVEASGLTLAPTPWPATLGAEQVEQSRLVLEAFARYWNTLRDAQMNPTAKDWASEFRAVATAEQADYLQRNLQESYVSRGFHSVSPATTENVYVSRLDAAVAEVSACADATNLRVQDANGRDMVDPPAKPRLSARIELTLTAPGVWKVSKLIDDADPQTC